VQAPRQEASRTWHGEGQQSLEGDGSHGGSVEENPDFTVAIWVEEEEEEEGFYRPKRGKRVL